MIQRLVRDESGIAMGLAVVMIVLIGVMGAGLLVFVRNDLEAVVEVNQGQRALEAADAGVQAARRQLLSDATADATTNIYDNNTGNGNSPWSAVSGGKNLPFNGNTVNVRIQYLLPSDTSAELSDPNYAPKLVTAPATDYPEPEDYFKITAEATAGNARRKIEAVYRTKDEGVPKGYYTPGKITINGSACVDSISLFSSDADSGGTPAVKFAGGGTGCGDVDGDGDNDNIKGPDIAYGDWNEPPFNTTARTASTCTAAGGITGMCAGIGAVGTINGSDKLGTRDFHGSTTNPTNPKFILKNPPDGSQTTSEMSFPFDYALPDIDLLRDEALKQEAESVAAGQNQNHYEEVTASTKDVTTWPTLPAGSDPARTVVFYKFTTPNGSNDVKWKVGNNCGNPPVEGTLVIEGGNFTTTQHTTPLKGAVIVRGGQSADGESDDTGGNTCLQGFINASGSIKIAGSVTPMAPADLADKRPGFYGIELWSWRERYE